MWSPYEKCKEIVRREWLEQSKWDGTITSEQFKKVAKRSLAELKLWSRTEFGGKEKRVKELINELKSVKHNFEHYMSGEKIKRLEKQIDNMLLDEEVYLKQRSRADWLLEGDRNTKFFHAKATARKRKNRIEGVLDENGSWSIEAEEIKRMFCEHFAELFTTTNPSRQQRESALKDMPKKVIAKMNEELGKPFTEEEIKEALFQMCPTKAPGPDGLPAAFFQKHWEVVKEGVTATCLHILNEKGTLAPLNHTYIALIPKIKKPRDVTEFRPISLCYECLHKIRMSKGKKNGLVALKLDISKAYDRVEWSFVEHAMYQLGFDRSWIELIMNCISTSSFSVLINGVPKGLIRPERGLRQGCPLSPYLFIICAEALSNLLNEAEKRQLIRGLKFNKEISINHLLFADDSLIFSKATVEECMSLKQIFECYATASGHIFNFEKSSMFFSGYISAEQMTKVRDIFQLKIVSKHEKYLGLPSMIGRKKVSFFKDIKLRILSKISSWQSKFFSSGGKETLIKAVAQAIPAYAMSVFRLPMTLCEDIRRALVAKQSWRIIKYPESLMAKILQAKYFKGVDFLQAKLGSKPSFVWRSIIWGRQVIVNGMRWRIGTGDSVKIYKSQWIPRPQTFTPISAPILDMDCAVAELIDENHKWKESLIQQHFNSEDAELISRILLPSSPKPDQILWHYDKKGNYSVKSGYQIAMRIKHPDWPSSSSSNLGQWNVIWSLELPEKIKIFMWKVARNFLPTAENLWRRKMLQEPTCPRCKMKKEDINHAIMVCKVAKEMWKLTPFVEEMQLLDNQDLLSMLQELVKRRSKDELRLLIALFWTAMTKIQAAAKVIPEKGAKWIPPPQGHFKANVDAAVNKEKNQVGLGVVIRDDSGAIIIAAVNHTKYHGDVAQAEAAAVNFGLQVVMEAKFRPLILETDCQDVVDFVLHNKSSRTEIYWTISEIQQKIQSFNSMVELQKIQRTCNAIAHTLAKTALANLESCVNEGCNALSHCV
ncbi:reverse transcriptase domain-containing protein [Citrus sinensis]|nr:reverse transcriptase domain-containing protein [Citrus sinensis]